MKEIGDTLRRGVPGKNIENRLKFYISIVDTCDDIAALREEIARDEFLEGTFGTPSYTRAEKIEFIKESFDAEIENLCDYGNTEVEIGEGERSLIIASIYNRVCDDSKDLIENAAREKAKEVFHSFELDWESKKADFSEKTVADFIAVEAGPESMRSELESIALDWLDENTSEGDDLEAVADDILGWLEAYMNDEASENSREIADEEDEEILENSKNSL